MMRPHFIWLAFVFCLAVVTLAMGWISHTVFRLESAEIQAARQSENERLALWRMDSALMPLITRESARPAYEYQPFYQPDNLYTRMFSPIDASRLQSRSSLITLDTKLIRLHFQFEADGSLSSPQVPTQSWRDFAEAQNFTTFERIEAYSRELKRLERKVTWTDLDQTLPQEVEIEPDEIPDDFQIADVQPNSAGDFQMENLPMQGGYLQQQLAEPLQQKRYQENTRSMKEFERRKGAAQKNQIQGNSYNQPAAQQPLPPKGQPGGEHAENAPQPGGKRQGQSRHGPMHAIWQGELLLLVRRVMLDGHASIQGCVLDWPEIRRRLLLDITDLLPDAKLVSVPETPTANRTLFLATLPVWLSPGKAPLEAIPSITPLRLSLLIAWGGVFLAAAAVAVLLMCVVRLSERRGAFVSAVTHELRTPLTTFRLYTEMLADGLVPTEEKRQSYLQTLRVEADRLGHLVENVLSYARLENGRSRLVRDEISLSDLLQRLERPLQERTERSGMTLDLDIADEQAPLCVRGDGGAIERIVFNLVDNACKYATESENRSIHLVCHREGNHALLAVRDHGKGIAPKSARRLFRPFSKSATEAAHSAPGVGLGLALCRRLAKSLGGKLVINPNVDDGACIVLRLPLCKSQDS